MFACALQAVLRLRSFEDSHIKHLKMDGIQPWFPTTELMNRFGITGSDTILDMIRKLIKGEAEKFQISVSDPLKRKWFERHIAAHKSHKLDHLQQIGIDKLGHRIKIKREIADIEKIL